MLQEIELCERYDALSEQWEKRLERLERKAKDHKTRELFEKVFPELKRIKEPSEKLNRTDSRGIGIIRSEAEFNELMDALNEQEEVCGHSVCVCARARTCVCVRMCVC